MFDVLVLVGRRRGGLETYAIVGYLASTAARDLTGLVRTDHLLAAATPLKVPTFNDRHGTYSFCSKLDCSVSMRIRWAK